MNALKSNITKDENVGNVSHFKVTEVILVHCNIVNNDYQHDSRVLYTFLANTSFGQLLDISPKNVIFFKTFNSEFLYIKVWFTDQNSKPLEIEDETDVFKNVSKRAIKRVAKAIGDLIGNKITKKSQKFQKIYNKIIQRQLQMRLIKK